MAFKKKNGKRKTSRSTSVMKFRRGGRRGGRRGSTTQASFKLDLQSGIMLALGALAVPRIAALVPAADNRIKYGAVTLLALLGVKRMPQLAPALIGLGAVAAAATLSAIAPQIAASVGGNGNGTKIGRLTTAEVNQRINEALMNRASMNGHAATVTGTPNMAIVGSR